MRNAVLGAGLGAGIGLIGVAFVAIARSRAHRFENLGDEAFMILIWCFAGAYLAWLSGPRLKIRPE
jgi:hypothetical protein